MNNIFSLMFDMFFPSLLAIFLFFIICKKHIAIKLSILRIKMIAKNIKGQNTGVIRRNQNIDFLEFIKKNSENELLRFNKWVEKLLVIKKN